MFTSEASHPTMLIACVLLTFITAGNALMCAQCFDDKGNFCQGPAVTCSATSDVCISTLVQNEINTSNPASASVLQQEKDSYFFERGCGAPKECGLDVIVRTPYNRIVTSRRCCQTDMCAPQTPRPIPESSTNQLTCPGCLSRKSEYCEPDQIVYCRGIETRCYTYSGKTDNVSISMSGCASLTACDRQLQLGSYLHCTTEGSSMGGTCPNSRLSYTLLTATFLFLMKILY
ncbi:phospholipase A2 inhibitor gamma subunit B-like [Discoglossus pictus]